MGYGLRGLTGGKGGFHLAAIGRNLRRTARLTMVAFI
jgi:hypothetical protein